MVRKIITNISIILGDNPLKTDTYCHRMPDFAVEGQHTCHAPVKSLLKLAALKGEEVETVICLCSEQATKPRAFIWKNRQGEGIAENKSPFDFFREGIESFCRDEGLKCPEFIQVPYNVNDISSNIVHLLAWFAKDDVIDIDVTGGGRDASFLTALCIEALEYRGVKIDNIVYSNRNVHPYEIMHEEDIDVVIDLINAVSDFTKHGRSHALEQCFKHSENENLIRFCRHLKVFSDKLAICRTGDPSGGSGDIAEDIRNVKVSLRDIENDPPASDAPTIEKVFYSLIPAIREQFVKDVDIPECPEKRSVENIFLIDWCLRQRMLPQALTLYRERVPKAIYDMGLITPPPEVRAVYDVLRRVKKEKHEHVSFEEYSMTLLRRLRTEGVNALGKEFGQSDIKLSEKTNADGKSELVVDGEIEGAEREKSFYVTCARAEQYGYNIHMSEDQLQACICYQFYLQFIRNAVMHAGVYAGSITDVNGRKFGVKTLHTFRQPVIPHDVKDQDQILDIANICQTLEAAVENLLELYETYGRNYICEKVRLQREKEREREAAWQRIIRLYPVQTVHTIELRNVEEGNKCVFVPLDNGFKCKIVLGMSADVAGLIPGDKFRIIIENQNRDKGLIIAKPAGDR